MTNNTRDNFFLSDSCPMKTLTQQFENTLTCVIS